MIKIEMKNYSMILTEKQWKKALSSGKIDNHESLTGEEILPPDKRRVIEQAKFTYSPLGKALENQIKTIEDQGETQIKALEEHGKQLVKYKCKNQLNITAFNAFKTKRNFWRTC